MPSEIPDFTAPKNRKLPVQLPNPVYLTDTLIYHLPAGQGNISLPENSGLECKYGRYQVKFNREGNTITVTRDILLHPGYIPRDEYGSFFDFIAAVKTDEKRNIIIH
jgi:hypothetical protein